MLCFGQSKTFFHETAKKKGWGFQDDTISGAYTKTGPAKPCGLWGQSSGKQPEEKSNQNLLSGNETIVFRTGDFLFAAIVKTAKEHEKCNIKLYEKFTQFKSKTNRD